MDIYLCDGHQALAKIRAVQFYLTTAKRARNMRNILTVFMSNPSTNNGFEPYEPYDPESDKVNSGGLKTPPAKENREAVEKVRAGIEAVLAGLRKELEGVTPETSSVSQDMIKRADEIDGVLANRLGNDQNKEGRQAA